MGYAALNPVPTKGQDLSIRSTFVRFARRAVLALSLPLLLLAQQGAWLHALSHSTADSFAATGQQDNGHDRHTKTCGLCLAFASFDGAAAPVLVNSELPAEHAPSVRAVLRQHSPGCAPHAYLSRAPPDLA